MVPHHAWRPTILLQKGSTWLVHGSKKTFHIPHHRSTASSQLYSTSKSSQTAACNLLGACCKISQTPNKSQSKTLLISGILIVLYLDETTPTPRQKTSPKGFSPTPQWKLHELWVIVSCWRFHWWLGETEAEFTPQHLQGMENLLELGLAEQRPPKSALPPSNVQVDMLPVWTSS